jgi:hypothetical protein
MKMSDMITDKAVMADFPYEKPNKTQEIVS